MSEGLGALENIGKKTMEVLTEGDPGETDHVVTEGGGGGGCITNVRHPQPLF